MSNINNTLQSIIGSKTVAFYSIFAKALGSVPAAVMLSQGLFWQERSRYEKHLVLIDNKAFFKKTAEEWYDETGLTKEQQLPARKLLQQFEIFETKLHGMPATVHFRVDIDAIVAVINRYQLTGLTVAVKDRNRLREKPRTSSGKFRQHAAVKDGYITNVESLESLESKGEDSRHHSIPSFFKNDSANGEATIQDSLIVASAQPHSTGFNFDTELAALIQDQFVLEQYQRSGNKAENFAADLGEFVLQIRGEAGADATPNYPNRREFRKHFQNWARKRAQIARDAPSGAKSPASTKGTLKHYKNDRGALTAPQKF